MYKHAEAKQLAEDHKVRLIEQLLELLPRIQPMIQQNQLKKENIDAACQLLGITLSEFDQCTQEEKNEVLLQIKRDIRRIQNVIGEKLFDNMPLVTKADNKIGDAVRRIDLHNVPQDRLVTDLHHGLRPEYCFFTQAAAKATCKDNCLHESFAPSHRNGVLLTRVQKQLLLLCRIGGRMKFILNQKSCRFSFAFNSLPYMVHAHLATAVPCLQKFPALSLSHVAENLRRYEQS